MARSRSSLVRFGLIAFALVGVAVVAIVVAGGGNDEPEIVRGAPDEGFPLRGDHADDDATIASAVDAWIRRERRGDERWARGDAPTVTALWAGRIAPDADGVVLAAEGRAAFLRRLHGRDHWQIAAGIVGEDRDPAIVAAGGAILVREGAEATFRQATPEGGGSPEIRTDDGLWHRGGSSLPEGALVLPDGIETRRATGERPPVAVFTADRPTLRALTPVFAERMLSGPESAPSPEAQRLVAAARSSSAPGVRQDSSVAAERLPVLDVVGERTLAPFGPVLVLSSSAAADPGSRTARTTLVAAAGGSAVAGADGATAIPLRGATDARRAASGPAIGAAVVRLDADDDERSQDDAPSRDDDTSARDETAYLLVAADDEVERIEVLSGRRSQTASPPVALLPAPWARSADDRRGPTNDVAVLGRTADGTLALPEPLTTDVVEVTVPSD